MTVNKVILVGRLGKDPEMRTTQSGTSVANLSLATSERRKNRDGNYEEHTEWHRLTAFGKTAEVADAYLEKGRQVYVEGKLRTRKWQDKDGQDRWSTEVVVDVLQFLGSRDAGQGRRDDRGSYGGGGNNGGGYGGGSYGGGQGNRSGQPDDDFPI